LTKILNCDRIHDGSSFGLKDDLVAVAKVDGVLWLDRICALSAGHTLYRDPCRLVRQVSEIRQLEHSHAQSGPCRLAWQVRKILTGEYKRHFTQTSQITPRFWVAPCCVEPGDALLEFRLQPAPVDRRGWRLHEFKKSGRTMGAEP
jgi:hypothetical protein